MDPIGFENRGVALFFAEMARQELMRELGEDPRVFYARLAEKVRREKQRRGAPGFPRAAGLAVARILIRTGRRLRKACRPHGAKRAHVGPAG